MICKGQILGIIRPIVTSQLIPELQTKCQVDYSAMIFHQEKNREKEEVAQAMVGEEQKSEIEGKEETRKKLKENKIDKETLENAIDWLLTKMKETEKKEPQTQEETKVEMGPKVRSRCPRLTKLGKSLEKCINIYQLKFY
jgi:glutamyl/glutaminyl-tRNA synthetase